MSEKKEASENGIIRLLQGVGEENIKIQNIAQGKLDINKLKKGDTKITFYTWDHGDISRIASGDRVGLICWFDKDDIPEWWGKDKKEKKEGDDK